MHTKSKVTGAFEDNLVGELCNNMMNSYYELHLLKNLPIQWWDSEHLALAGECSLVMETQVFQTNCVVVPVCVSQLPDKRNVPRPACVVLLVLRA